MSVFSIDKALAGTAGASQHPPKCKPIGTVIACEANTETEQVTITWKFRAAGRTWELADRHDANDPGEAARLAEALIALGLAGEISGWEIAVGLKARLQIGEYAGGSRVERITSL